VTNVYHKRNARDPMCDCFAQRSRPVGTLVEPDSDGDDLLESADEYEQVK
jgi:hypothetical protein